ncbi:2-succinylbenzoate--CoA ligase-like [Eupeodes corollae]|uniref:2-succinylbenzoate--CoA ligase-like n=1 Tax=Eupeodes corollae TaxID=290404 RepID=UPI00249109A3|nr:2-succinylbenzoate--CoA ligase-like [Eupeodes corollae]
MQSVEYVKSQKIWRAPEFKIGSFSLGAVILEKLKHSDQEKILEVHHESGTHVTVKETRVKKNDRVVLFTNLNLKITPLTFACYTIGAPVCFFETYLEEEHVPVYLEMLDPSVIIYEERFKSMVTEGLKNLNLTNLRHVLTLDGDQQSVDELLFEPVVDIESFKAPDIGDPRTLPAILGFTSATTGLPKIIMNSHAMVRHSAYNGWEADPESVVMVLSELRWSCQQVAMIQPALLGVKRIYSSTPPLEFTGEIVRKMIDKQQVTHYFDVPIFMRTVFEAVERSKENEPSTLFSLKFAWIGGESDGGVLEAYIAKIRPHCRFVKCYGMTEVANAIATTEQIPSKQNINGGILKKGFVLKLMDKNGNSLGPNQIGRVCIKAAAPFLGYLKNDMANMETFIEGGWLNTGDLGIVDSDNFLNIFTREKYALKYADGTMLIPNSVENFVNNFEDVHSSALVGNSSADNPKQCCGTIFVVLRKGIPNSADFENSFRAYLRKELAKKQLDIIKYFKVLDDLPYTSCLKVDRMALKNMVNGGCKI